MTQVIARHLLNPRSDFRHWPEVVTPESLRVIPKIMALKRLDIEGREEAFRKRQAHIRKYDKKKREEAFYIALVEFPPVG